MASPVFDSRGLTTDGRSFGEIIREDADLRGVLTGPDCRRGDRFTGVEATPTCGQPRGAAG